MTPLLSVCVRTYNQEHFVSDALESILRQKTSFDYEILVSDDYSSDKTQSILSDYKQRYPDRIKLILGDNNIGGPNNLRRVIEASSSKYLAFLDGDDYYIDDYKLQKQIEFLESHSDFAACFHNVVDIDERQNGRRSLFLPLDFPEKHIDAQIIIGDTCQIDDKLRRAEIFIKQKAESPELKDIKIINFKYKNQVVCTKR